MDTMTKPSQATQATQEHIRVLLAELSPDNLAFVEQFVLFLRDRMQSPAPLVAREKRVPYLYPTVPVPASKLDAWMNLVPEGYDGDALADSEALYDDV